MNWIDVAKVIAPLAPAAGSILGGFIPFPGGSLIGEQFGKIIARQFGVPETPAAVAGAIAGSSNELALAKINQATELARKEIDGFVAVEQAYLEAVKESLRQVNATMRLEVLPENRHWFFTGWRPAAGWVFVIYAAVFGAILMVAGVASAFFDKTQSLDRLTAAWPIYAAYFATLAAMVGVYVIGRSQEKVNRVADPIPLPPVKPAVKK